MLPQPGIEYKIDQAARLVYLLLCDTKNIQINKHLETDLQVKFTITITADSKLSPRTFGVIPWVKGQKFKASKQLKGYSIPILLLEFDLKTRACKVAWILRPNTKRKLEYFADGKAHLQLDKEGWVINKFITFIAHWYDSMKAEVTDRVTQDFSLDLKDVPKRKEKGASSVSKGKERDPVDELTDMGLALLHSMGTSTSEMSKKYKIQEQILQERIATLRRHGFLKSEIKNPTK